MAKENTRSSLAFHEPENRAMGSEVFVGGLSRTVTESTIHQMKSLLLGTAECWLSFVNLIYALSVLFSPYGEIVEIRLMKDQNGISKGFCFVRYAEKESAIWAKREKNGVEVTNHQVCLVDFNV